MHLLPLLVCFPNSKKHPLKNTPLPSRVTPVPCGLIRLHSPIAARWHIYWRRLRRTAAISTRHVRRRRATSVSSAPYLSASRHFSPLDVSWCYLALLNVSEDQRRLTTLCDILRYLRLLCFVACWSSVAIETPLELDVCVKGLFQTMAAVI